MSEQYPGYPVYASGWAVAEPPPPPPPPNAGDDARADLRAAGIVVAALAVVGALLGLAWAAWSGPQQRAYVIAPGRLYPFDEVETMAGADGRYLVLVGAAGLIAGFLLWLRRRGNRGPLAVLSLLAGGLAGAALTWGVGHLARGGTYDGRAGTTIAHLPLTLHLPGLLFIEPALAILVYGLFAAFAVRDDLGRADPVRDRLLVQSGQHPEYGWGNGDAPGAAQQGDLPPQ
jgi:hypothetical protein